VQVYPPLAPVGGAGAEPLPVFDTSELPPPGAVPPVIQPDPGAPAPLPPATNAPAAAAGGAPPLPPGIDDVTPSKPEEKKPEGQ
jgi:hypothetical protein